MTGQGQREFFEPLGDFTRPFAAEPEVIVSAEDPIVRISLHQLQPSAGPMGAYQFS